MFPADAFTIRYADDDRDAATLRRLAELDSRPPLAGRVLLAEDDGVAIAAYSVTEGRTVADPFRHTERALIMLRMRASALAAYERTPSLRDRLSAAVRVTRRTPGYAGV
jgi:hypothetical protein